MRPVKEIAADLRKKGLKLTPQRRLIIEILSRDRSHPTVDDVYQQVLAIMPEVSRTTVYNTIREMAFLGEIEEVQNFDGGGARYDTSVGNHHHFFCLSCRSLIDVDVNLPDEEEFSRDLEGFEVSRALLTLYGRCPYCVNKEGAGSVRAAGNRE